MHLELYYNINQSFWHDINCWVDKEIVNMVIEIPQNHTLKTEISKKNNNPIICDIKNGEIRYTKLPYPFNYGAIPQTWENPHKFDKLTNKLGDNDPLDIFDISNIQNKIGDIIQVKILGSICVIDNNQTDWKIIGQNINDKTSYDLSQIIHKIIFFLKNYKDDKIIIYDKIYNINETIQIVNSLHEEWKYLHSQTHN